MFFLFVVWNHLVFLFIVVKPGKCPYNGNEPDNETGKAAEDDCSAMQNDCLSDNDCNVDEKCCNASCGMRCKKPVFIDGTYIYIFMIFKVISLQIISLILKLVSVKIQLKPITGVFRNQSNINDEV